MKNYFIDFGAGVVASYPFSLVVFIAWPGSWFKFSLLILSFLAYSLFPFNRRRFGDKSTGLKVYIAPLVVFAIGLFLGSVFLNWYALSNSRGLFLL